MPDRIAAYSVATLAALTVSALTIWFYLGDILKYVEQRPYAPELGKVAATLKSGDTYTLQWTPEKAGPQPAFFYVERSTDKSFASAPRYHVLHQAGKKPSRLFIAPAVSGITDYHHRVLTGIKSKHFAGAEILSDPSNVVTVSVQPIPDPSLLPIKGPLYAGKAYTVSWTAVTNANAYTLEEQSPSVTSQPKLSATAKSFTKSPLAAGGAKYCYRVQAAKTVGSSWVPITGWSKKQCVQVKDVAPPPNLTATPQTVEPGKPYKISWNMPPSGPQPTSAYKYQLRRTTGATVNELPPQTATATTFTAPTVTSPTKIQYEVRALYGSNPMTFYSSPVTVTIQPPVTVAPSITKVDPVLAPRGTTVKITGKDLGKAAVTLYASTSGKSIPVTPTSQTNTAISFTVPQGASLKTTHVKVSAAAKTAQASFTVGRDPGKFLERQKNVTTVPLKQSCGKFASELEISKYGPLYFTGRFKEGSKVLQNFPYPGFLVYNYKNAVLGGLGFSKNCKIGLQVGDSKGSSSPVFINFYSLSPDQDSQYSAGAKIKGPHPIEPSVYYPQGYKVLISPDESIAAVINRRKPFTDQYGITIYAIDLLTGKKLPNSPYLYDGKKGSSFNLSVDNKNQFVIQRVGGTTSSVLIPSP